MTQVIFLLYNLSKMPIFKHLTQFFKPQTKVDSSADKNNSKMTYLVVGLGNKGEKYDHTRHNVGRQIVASLMSDLGENSVYNQKIDALIADFVYDGQKVVALLPENYMNNSGVSVRHYLNFFKDTYCIVVVHDELDLPLGKIKLSHSKNAGGHNGVQSVFDQTSKISYDILRVRVGIGPNDTTGEKIRQMRKFQTKNFVLGQFTVSEEVDLREAQTKAVAVLKTLFSKGEESAQKILNN